MFRISDFDKSMLGFADIAEVGRAAYAALDQVQRVDPKNQALAMAVLFVLFNRRLRDDFSDVMQVGVNMVDKGWRQSPHIQAIAKYLEVDLEGQV